MIVPLINSMSQGWTIIEVEFDMSVAMFTSQCLYRVL